jgi:methylated-DNA-protein-cysteine methyltransferase-like protein
LNSKPKVFYRRIWNTVAAIPLGRVASYGQVAELAGHARGARLVSRALRAAPASLDLPWHRVVNAHGRISIPKNRSSHDEQIQRLEKESVQVSGDRVDMSRYGWWPDLDELVWGPPALAIADPGYRGDGEGRRS